MLALCTDSLSRYGLNRVFRFAKEAGFDGVDLAITKDYDSQNGTYIKELSDEYQVPVLSITGSPKTNKKTIEQAIDIAKTVGCEIVVLQPPELFNFRLASWIKKEIPEIRKREKLHICLENTDAKTILGILPQYSLNSMTDLKNFKAVSLDTANIVDKKLDLLKFYDELKEHIYHIHFADATTSKDHILPGRGVVALESLLTKLKEDQYKYAISLRVKASELKAGDDEKVLKRLKKVRSFYEQYFK